MNTWDLLICKQKLIHYNLIVISNYNIPHYKINADLNYIGDYVCSTYCYLCHKCFRYKKYHPEKKIPINKHEALCNQCYKLLYSKLDRVGILVSEFKIIGQYLKHHKGSLLICYNYNVYIINVQRVTIPLLSKMIKSKKNTNTNDYVVKYHDQMINILMLLTIILNEYYLNDIKKQIILNYINVYSSNLEYELDYL